MDIFKSDIFWVFYLIGFIGLLILFPSLVKNLEKRAELSEKKKKDEAKIQKLMIEIIMINMQIGFLKPSVSWPITKNRAAELAGLYKRKEELEERLKILTSKSSDKNSR